MYTLITYPSRLNIRNCNNSALARQKVEEVQTNTDPENGRRFWTFYHRKRGFLRSQRNLLLKEAEGLEGLPNLLNLPLSEI